MQETARLGERLRQHPPRNPIGPYALCPTASAIVNLPVLDDWTGFAHLQAAGSKASVRLGRRG
jgi:hypothetical protein